MSPKMDEGTAFLHNPVVRKKTGKRKYQFWYIMQWQKDVQKIAKLCQEIVVMVGLWQKFQ